MPVCINEAKPGGKFPYEWTGGKGGGFYITGEFVELEPHQRIVHVERMHLREPRQITTLKCDLKPTEQER